MLLLDNKAKSFLPFKCDAQKIFELSGPLDHIYIFHSQLSFVFITASHKTLETTEEQMTQQIDGCMLLVEIYFETK